MSEYHDCPGCGRSLRIGTSNSVKNPGRRFIGCKDYRDTKGCGFFGWEDEGFVEPEWKTKKRQRSGQMFTQSPAPLPSAPSQAQLEFQNDVKQRLTQMFDALQNLEQLMTLIGQKIGE